MVGHLDLHFSVRTSVRLSVRPYVSTSRNIVCATPPTPLDSFCSYSYTVTNMTWRWQQKVYRCTSTSFFQQPFYEGNATVDIIDTFNYTISHVSWSENISTVFNKYKWSLLHIISMKSRMAWHIIYEALPRFKELCPIFDILKMKVCLKLLPQKSCHLKMLFVVCLIPCDRAEIWGILFTTSDSSCYFW